MGILHLFLLHTSASLCINENYDPTVRQDLEDALDRNAPEGGKGGCKYRHSLEGLDDMPEHIKRALIGPSHSIPVTNGELSLGTWQGIYLLEHRSGKQYRKVVCTLQGIV